MRARTCPRCGFHSSVDAWNCETCGETLSVNTIAEIDDETLRIDNQRVLLLRQSPPQDQRVREPIQDILKANVCKSCGQELRENMRFCWWCGEDIHDIRADDAIELPLDAPELRVVRCAAPKCVHPVIGQCTGYKRDCRRYYCAIHSNVNLCYECTMRQFVDEEAERVKRDYLENVESIRQKARKLAWKRNELKWIGGISLVLGMIGVFTSDSDIGSLFCTLWFLGFATALAVYWSIVSEIERNLVLSVSQQKSDFPDFYEAWKREKRKDLLGVIGAIIGFIFVAVLATIASEAQSSNENARVRRAVDDDLRRRGL